MARTSRLSPLLAAAALAVALPAAGCGGGGSSGGGGGSSTGAAQSPATVVASGDPAAGKQVFGDNCAACHGQDAEGGTGPNLHQEPFTQPDLVVGQIRNGGGGMPAFEGRLSEKELADVAAYVTRDVATKPK